RQIVGHPPKFQIFPPRSKGGKQIARLIDSPHLPEGEAIFIVKEEGIRD
ncbi:MAG TPA: DNA repair and recombination protein RadA, partial [Thermoplasmatales archaeon]|nr:DNA repair and recombination protein RadA [Thermoplasmatales archaeon]